MEAFQLRSALNLEPTRVVGVMKSSSRLRAGPEFWNESWRKRCEWRLALHLVLQDDEVLEWLLFLAPGPENRVFENRLFYLAGQDVETIDEDTLRAALRAAKGPSFTLTYNSNLVPYLSGAALDVHGLQQARALGSWLADCGLDFGDVVFEKLLDRMKLPDTLERGFWEIVGAGAAPRRFPKKGISFFEPEATLPGGNTAIAKTHQTNLMPP